MDIIVDALCNTHAHIRELFEVMRALIILAIKGGTDVILPMPNTKEGLRTCQEVANYKHQACSLVPFESNLRVVPILLINEDTTEKEITKCVSAGVRDGKVYPLDRTTKSHNGVRDYGRLLGKIKHCGEIGMNVHLHPEHPWMAIGNRDAEYLFLSIAEMFLRLTNATLIWEHGTDARCIQPWEEMAQTGRFFVTLTAHHLVSNEDQAFGDVRLTCKPPCKTEQDRLGLIQLVECGAFTTPFLLQLYAHALDDLLASGAGQKTFVNFTSRNARKFHRLTPASRNIQLIRQEFVIPESYQVGPWYVEPVFAGKPIKYSLA
ncbi:MAG: hypothetical protein NT094_02430 [Candidatus Staskawiczbacteria bacterium]|nr:hypothetical protein [Candidatus Staskawiczbacteria bacterium]